MTTATEKRTILGESLDFLKSHAGELERREQTRQALAKCAAAAEDEAAALQGLLAEHGTHLGGLAGLDSELFSRGGVQVLELLQEAKAIREFLADGIAATKEVQRWAGSNPSTELAEVDERKSSIAGLAGTARKRIATLEAAFQKLTEGQKK